MKIQRIDTYDDPKFTKEALYQHGCYLVDGEPYEVVIVSKNEAVICGKNRSVYCDVIDYFRLHAPHIITSNLTCSNSHVCGIIL